MKRLMTVDEAKEVRRDRSVWHSVLFDYPAKDIGDVIYIICTIKKTL